MSKYSWKPGEPPPVISNHSLCKHGLIKDYLIDYINIRAASSLHYGDSVFNLTVIDGFSGGGCYRQNGIILPGSPLVIIEGIEEAIAEFEIKNDKGRVNFKIDVICIDEDRDAVSFLDEVIREKRNNYKYGEILTWHGKFGEYLPRVMAHIKKKSNVLGKCIFVLDQYGYKDVLLDELRRIMGMDNSEVILTFAIDALVTFFKEAAMRNIGLPDLDVEELAKHSDCPDILRAKIERMLSQHIIERSGARFNTPFFVNSDNTHWGYWLVHLSRHYKGRSVMIEQHWKYANNVIHYGGAGLKMLSYRSRSDSKYTRQDLLFPEYRFDKYAKDKSMESLPDQITELVREKGSMSVKQFMMAEYNDTPASMDMIKEAVQQSVEDGQLSMNHRRRNKNNIKDSDILTYNKQMVFDFGRGRK